MLKGNDEKKVIITAALTGVLANRNQCPAIPYTPKEIALEAKRSYDAGATVAHIHARDPETGAPTFSVAIYRQIMEETRKLCDIIINFSTGGIGIPMEERVAHIRDLKPEIGALNMGSMNYAKYSQKKKAMVFDMVFANPFEDIIYLLNIMKTAHVKPELECFDTGHIGNVSPLIDMGLLSSSQQFSFIMGVLGGIPPTAECLALMSNLIPNDSTWEIIGISHVQWKLIASALSLGGNIRVGLEDNFYVNDNQMANSNGELVEKAARMVRDVGREVASVTDAKRSLKNL